MRSLAVRRSFLLAGLVVPAHVLADDETDAVTVRARRAPPSETVIGHAEIERTGGVSLADALRPQADVDLPGGGSPGSLGRLTLRGSAPEETLLVIDGLRVSSRSSALAVAGADPNLVPVSLLQRVSILRGPSSALWGANAVAGVVELTTREPTAPRAFTGTLQYAAYLSPEDDDAGMPATMPMDDDDEPFEGGVQPFYGLRGQFTVATREQERYFVAGVSGSYTRGWVAGTQGHLLDATVKAGRTYDHGGTAYVWTRLFDSYSGAPSWGSLLSADAFDADDRQARQGAQVVGVVRRTIGTRLSLEAGVSLSVARTTLYNPDADITAGVASVESRQSSSELQGRLAWTREAWGPFGDFTFGVDFGHETLNAEGFGPSGATRGGVFARDQRRFGPVTVDVAVRLDGDSLYGWFVSPRVALRANTTNDLVRAELSAGRAFRPPTFGERTWPVFVYATPADGVVGERGNPDVGVERAWGGDAALALGGGDRRWQATVRGFGLYTEDLIRWAVDGDGYWTPTNVDHAWSAGATVEGSVRVHPRLTLVGSGFWQTTRDEQGDEVQGRLRSKVVGRVVWYARTGLRAWVEALWFDRSGTDARGEAWQGVFVNARVGWQLASGVGAFVLGENLLDTRFESVRGLPTPGRVAWVGLSLDVDED